MEVKVAHKRRSKFGSLVANSEIQQRMLKLFMGYMHGSEFVRLDVNISSWYCDIVLSLILEYGCCNFLVLKSRCCWVLVVGSRC